MADLRLLVGNETKDDAAVFALSGDINLVSTVDFFTPIVDDARTFGRVASANALSDVYAMGGTPLFALAVLGWPADKLPPEMAALVLEGARDTCAEVGITLAGGHSIDAPEPFFGLSVTGRVVHAELKRNNGARPGDLLILTKPIGTGVLATALKRGKLEDDLLKQLTDQLVTINRAGATVARCSGVHAMTDVTGFGLLGHLWEMCDASRCAVELAWDHVPVLQGARELVGQGVYADGGMRNWRSVHPHVQGASTMERMILGADPQTNGGLLIAVDPADSDQVRSLLASMASAGVVIGKFTSDEPRIFVA